MNSLPDAFQRQLALDPSQSFIVQAPAGSGKTELLIQRFLKLLGYAKYPEQILAITFTRKAAAEMKSRILAALESAESEAPSESPHGKLTHSLAEKVLKQDREKKWNLKENGSRLRIQTIDSFCMGLIEQMPLLSNLGGTPAIDEDASTLYKETATKCLELAESENSVGETIRKVLIRLDNSKRDFISKIVGLLNKRSEWVLPFFESAELTQDDKNYLEGILEKIITVRLESINLIFPDNLKEKLASLAAFAGENLRLDSSENELARLSTLKAFPSPIASQLNEWKLLSQLIFTQKGELRKNITKTIGFPTTQKKEKKDFKEILETIYAVPNLPSLLFSVQSLPLPKFPEDEWDSLKSFISLLPKLETILRQVFAAVGKTDFAEISLSALKALGSEDDPTDLLLKADMQLQHILVDEFQDTSFKQFRLLTLLTSGWEKEDGRTCFLVGDPMQSIYRFRDAEVGLFIKAQKEGIKNGHVTQVHLEPLSLTTNFRSQAKIVDWTNQCFQQIFPNIENIELGSIPFTPSQAILQAEDGPGAIIHSFNDPKSNEEAQSIVNLIHEIRNNDPKSTIAVLVRARPHLSGLIPLLQKSEIPFSAEEIDTLDKRPAVLDLLSLTRAIHSIWDRLAWLSILRAPWCGLSFNDIFLLSSSEPQVPIWEMLKILDTSLSKISGDGQDRIKRFFGIMEKVLNSKLERPLSEVAEGAWIALGGPACVSQAGLRDADTFFQKMKEKLDGRGTYLLRNFEKVLERLFASPETDNDNPVHIMTIHKAKGLEFDHVLLPGLGRRKKTESGRLLFWIPYGDDLLLAPLHEKGNPKLEIYQFLKSIDKEKENLEILRTLYVATTRAKKRLHLFGHLQENKEGKRPVSNSQLEKLWPFLGNQWPEESEASDETVVESNDEVKVFKHQIRRLPKNYTPHEPGPNILDEQNLDKESILPTEYVWAGNKARCLGVTLHAIFQEISKSELSVWESKDQNSLEKALKTRLLSEGLPSSDLDSVIQEGVKAIKNIFEDPKGRWIFQNHKDHQSEYALSGFISDSPENRIIDRTFIDANNVRWIVDFKTGKHEGANIETFFEEEKKRYNGQLKDYETLFKQLGETRKIKKALYYPMHKRFIEIV
jgi:ATP-dependent helicase/nuclease subunit A